MAEGGQKLVRRQPGQTVRTETKQKRQMISVFFYRLIFGWFIVDEIRKSCYLIYYQEFRKNKEFDMHQASVIALTGKGGVGKTSLSAAIVRV